ncbi:MAG TPA: hypothetical protein VIU61_13095 [Kofleriaceae bacterium]
MKAVVVLVLLASCDLQPPPKKEPPRLAPADAAIVAIVRDASMPVIDAAPVIVDAGAGRPTPDAMIVVTEDCVQVGVEFARVYIATAVDMAERSAAERDQTRMVRKMAELCTIQTWNADKRTCWLKATTRDAHKKCAEMK